MGTLQTTSARPIRKSAQRLRWFITAFEDQTAHTSAQTGATFQVDRTALAEVFAKWLTAFEAQKPHHIKDKAAYVGFAAGLMLRTLIQQKPVNVVALPDDADKGDPAYFWPEGHLYVAFCLNVRGMVLAQDYQSEQVVSDASTDLQTWWSFRENTAEDPNLAIAFLDLFSGDQPNWSTPQIFQVGRYRKIASRIFTPIVVS
jgi:hypothetical protein